MLRRNTLGAALQNAPRQQAQGGVDAEQRHHPVSDSSDRYLPIYHPLGKRRNLSAEPKNGKAR